MPEKVVVTGGAGFIGSALLRALEQRGYDAASFDTRENPVVESIIGDIRNYESLVEALKGADYVFHEAVVSNTYSVLHPQDSLAINIIGSYNVFKAAMEGGVKKLVFASSAEVYGDAVYLPMDEDHPLKPVTHYSIAKLACEEMLALKEFESLKSVVLRYFNVYGPGQKGGAVPSFIDSVRAGRPPKILGDGLQEMDFVHLQDVVSANMAAIASDATKEAFNIGSGDAVTINYLASKIEELAGATYQPDYIEAPEMAVFKRQADINKAKRLLGWSPRVSLDEGLLELVEAVKKHLAAVL